MTPLPRGPRGIFRINYQAMTDPIGTTLRWQREYGDTMSFPDLEGKGCLSTGAPAVIRTLFSAPPETFAPFSVDMLSCFVGDTSVLVLAGAQHAAMRRLLMPPFHGQRLRVYGQQIRELAMQNIRDFKPGTRFVAQQLMHAISLQTIIHLVFGVTEPERVACAQKRVADFRRAFSSPLIVLPILLRWLRRELWGIGPWARRRRSIRALHAFFGEEIARRRSERRERTDILSLLLAARHEDGSGLSDPEIYDQLITLLLAGHATTGDALAWALYFLAREPEARGRLQAELAALGSSPEPEALAKLPYLEAVCHETMRMRPSVPSVGRRLRGPLQFGGHELPAGYAVSASVLCAHNNPEIFPQPERFVPERFLDRTYSPFEFLPFGGGQRRCVGAAFAIYEMKLVLGTLLGQLDFELASKRPIRPVMTTTLMPSRPIQLRVRARSLSTTR